MQDLRERLAFLGLRAEDAERLKQCITIYDAMADVFAALFYDHLFAHGDTAKFLTDPALVERLKQSQKRHLRTMFEARWDQQYAEQRRQVGKVHADIGIEPRYFLAAYSQFLGYYLSTVLPPGHCVTQADAERQQSTIKGLFLDIGLSLDAYFARQTDDLRRALDLVWKANKELKQFAHFTSHDLKTPLGTVANLCDEVLDEFGERIPHEAHKLIESARQTAFRMSTMIDELLSLSIPKENDIAEEPVSIGVFLTEALDRVQHEFKRCNIEATLPKTFPRVVANKTAMREVFYNLFSNAAKYIQRQPGRVTVDARTVGDECVISVLDNGPGIPAEELLRVFAPFHRLQMHQDAEGSGLGLYFTKNQVEQQGGRIWVESSPGEGSCFFVSLKLASER